MNIISMFLIYYVRASFKAICDVNQVTVELGSWESIKSALTYTSVISPQTNFLFAFLPFSCHRGVGERSLQMTLCLSVKRTICYYQLQPAKKNFGQCCCPKLSLSQQILGIFCHFTFALFCEVKWQQQRVDLVYIGNIFC